MTGNDIEYRANDKPVNRERWRQIERIFHSALERPSRDRKAFLENECRGDEDLGREVQSLLSRAASAENFLDKPVAAAAQLIQGTAAETSAARILSTDSIRGFAPGLVLDGRNRVIALLGRGGMGEVYRADDLKLGTPVALKFLPRALAGDPVRSERFMTEVRTARQVAHPNVCRVFDISETSGAGHYFLTMEYVDGEDLASLLLRIGRLPIDKALDIARQICAGLAAAHACGVLHRDLKPANVMLDGRGRVRIMDFGLAVAVDDKGLEGDVSGTPAYMAPEQLGGKGASVRTDIYALGLVLYEIYTGKRAYTAMSLSRAARAQGAGVAPCALRTDQGHGSVGRARDPACHLE